jgi:hypothetical protein
LWIPKFLLKKQGIIIQSNFKTQRAKKYMKRNNNFHQNLFNNSRFQEHNPIQGVWARASSSTSAASHRAESRQGSALTRRIDFVFERRTSNVERRLNVNSSRNKMLKEWHSLGFFSLLSKVKNGNWIRVSSKNWTIKLHSVTRVCY